MINRMLWAIVLVLFASASAWAQTGDPNDPNEPDTLYVESVTANAGQIVAVDVNFANDEELAAITIPLTWSSPDITLDSVSYIGSRIDYIATKPVTIYPSERTVVFGAIIIMEANIPVGSGLAGTMYFTVPPGTPDQYIVIDTITRGPASMMFTNLNSSNFVPIYSGGRIQVGNPQLPPHIELSVTEMTFDGTFGFPSPPSQQLVITNSGEGTLDWNATTSSSWLSVIPSSGTATSIVGVNANTTGLSEGTYYDTVVVSCVEADNSPQLLPVTLNVVKLPPEIAVDPSSVNVSAIQGGSNPADRYLHISTTVPGSDLSWSVTNTESWLSLSPSSGAPPDSVQLSFDISGLSFGYYYDTVVVTDPNATNSPYYVPVTLQIVSDLPVMEIDPSVLDIVGKVGVNAAPRSVYIYNSGEGAMTFEVSESSDLITNVVPLNGTAPTNITFTFSTDTLAIGDYYDTVTITSPEAVNSPKEVVIHYHIAGNPADLYVIPGSISMSYYECWQGLNSTPPKKYFQIQNNGGGVLYWTATSHSDWLNIEYESGTGNIVNSVTLSADGLPVGVYVDTITVQSDVAMNSPKKIVVTLNVVEGTQTPQIVVQESIENIPVQEVFGVLLGDLAAVGEVVNQNPGCMDYWVEEDIPWLTIVDSIGQAPATLRAIIDVGSYTYGTYPDSLLVYSSSALNSPVVIHLNMLVWRLHGDHNWDNRLDVGEAVRMINYIFKHGPAAQPEPLVDDTNCDFFVDVSDVVIIINYIFKHGNKPCGNL